MKENRLPDLTGFRDATSSKKVGILTFHRCINYGSYWQARCLVEGLREKGFDAVILNHVSKTVDVAEWRVALRPTLPTWVPLADVAAYKEKTRTFLRAISELPLSSEFELDYPESLPEYDFLVIGSDEVWNLRHPWYAGQPIFFGDGFPARQKIAYAASFGNYSCWEGIGSPYSDFIGKLDDISVRDENSWWMLKNTLGLDTQIVLDPTLQFPPPPVKDWLGFEEPFALVYGHNFSDSFATSMRNWASDRNLPLVSIGYRNDWADQQWLNAGPIEFAAAMNRAESVITNFFHGCAFSLINEKPFCCEVTDYRSIKVRGLMELLGAENHLIEGSQSEDALHHRLSTPPDHRILRRISEVRHTSHLFLNQALGDRCPSRS